MHETKSVSGYFHLAMTRATSTDSTNLSCVPSAVVPLLHQCTDLFQEPQELPPACSTSHHIRLAPNTDPVNVRPYWFPFFQKQEIQKN